MNEEMRKEFEEWFSSYCNERGFNYSFATLLNGEYASWPEHNAYVGWQASRESMKVIKLPKHSNPVKDKTIMFISDVKILLESAGVKVEVEE